MSRYAENSVAEGDSRLENKNTEIPSKLENAYIVSEALRPTTLASGNKGFSDLTSVIFFVVKLFMLSAFTFSNCFSTSLKSSALDVMFVHKIVTAILHSQS